MGERVTFVMPEVRGHAGAWWLRDVRHEVTGFNRTIVRPPAWAAEYGKRLAANGHWRLVSVPASTPARRPARLSLRRVPY